MLSMSDNDVCIRRADGLADYLACVELQKLVWGYEALDDSLPMLVIGNKYGGAVLVCEDPGKRIIGFAFAMPGWTPRGERLWWSHMTAVLPEYRGRNIGLQLKLHQRREALACGVSLIEWTFDPMQAMNAHFNLRKLGAVVREYEENVYGYTSSPLHRGLPTDRFVAEWHLQSGRVRQHLDIDGSSVILRDIDRMPRINAAGSEPNLNLDDSPLLLEIPSDVNYLKIKDLSRVERWQDHIRAACLHYFQAGYSVTDFTRFNDPEPRACYILERSVSG